MNGLEQLQPLISPPPIAFWPPAPGWWLLLLLLPALGFAAWRLRRFIPLKKRPIVPCRATARSSAHRRPCRIGANAQTLRRRPGWRVVATTQRPAQTSVPQHYPYSQSHTLNGRKWLAFLDNRCPAAGLTRWMVLVEGAYKPECKLDDKAIAGLTQAVDTWIRKHV
jgi:hypothetical protein